MCEAALFDYAGALNSFADNSGDLIPTVIGFTGENCSGAKMVPGHNVITEYAPLTPPELPANQTLAFPEAAQSLIIPFNYPQLKIISQGGTDRVLQGGTAWRSLPFAAASVHIPATHAVPWTSYLRSLCLGANYTLGGFHLHRFQPQSQRCDQFFVDYCAESGTHASTDECACLQGQRDLLPVETRLGVSLPVACFSQKCAERLSYRTAAMQSQPCNGLVCQQIIRSHGNAPELPKVNAKVYCGASFFHTDGTTAATARGPGGTSSQPSGDTGDKDPATPLAPAHLVVHTRGGFSFSHQPLYVWIMLGLAGVVFVVVIVLLFLPRGPPGAATSFSFPKDAEDTANADDTL